jgi:hypothetical protein
VEIRTARSSRVDLLDRASSVPVLSLGLIDPLPLRDVLEGALLVPPVPDPSFAANSTTSRPSDSNRLATP